MEPMTKNAVEKSKAAFADLIGLMNRPDIDVILNSTDSNWKNKVVEAMLTYAITTVALDRYDIRRLNVEACWMKSIYLAGYEHGKIDSVALIVEGENKP